MRFRDAGECFAEPFMLGGPFEQVNRGGKHRPLCAHDGNRGIRRLGTLQN
jgi:hypothetical protein